MTIAIDSTSVTQMDTSMLEWMKRMARALIPDEVWQEEYGNGTGEWVVKPFGTATSADFFGTHCSVGYKILQGSCLYGVWVGVTETNSQWCIRAGVGYDTKGVSLGTVEVGDFTYTPPSLPIESARVPYSGVRVKWFPVMPSRTNDTHPVREATAQEEEVRLQLRDAIVAVLSLNARLVVTGNILQLEYPMRLDNEGGFAHGPSYTITVVDRRDGGDGGHTVDRDAAEAEG